jgi:hypothetical protein
MVVGGHETFALLTVSMDLLPIGSGWRAASPISTTPTWSASEKLTRQGGDPIQCAIHDTCGSGNPSKNAMAI